MPGGNGLVRHTDGRGAGENCFSLNLRHLVFLEKAGDSGVEGGDDFVFATDQLVKVKSNSICFDAVVFSFFLQSLQKFRRVQKCLRRDAADIEACAPQFLHFDTGGLEPELSGTDGCNISSRAGPYHYDIKGGLRHFYKSNNSLEGSS